MKASDGSSVRLVAMSSKGSTYLQSSLEERELLAYSPVFQCDLVTSDVTLDRSVVDVTCGVHAWIARGAVGTTMEDDIKAKSTIRIVEDALANLMVDCRGTLC